MASLNLMFSENPLVTDLSHFSRSNPWWSFFNLAKEYPLVAILENIQKRPLGANFGIMFGESLLVAYWSNLFWDRPLMSNFGNLTKEFPQWQIWESCFGIAA